MVLFGLPYGSDQSCSVTLVDHGRGYLGILVSCLICESAIMWLSMRGSILYTQPREAVQYVLYIRLGKTRIFFLYGTVLHRITCWWLWLWEFVWFQVKVGTLCILIGYWLITILITPLTSLSSYSVGRASICCGGNCLACSVLPAMLWCHCQKPGFGWVKAGIKNGNAQEIYFSMLLMFIILCRNRCMQLACDIQCLHYPHVHLWSYGSDFCQT